LVPMGNVCNGIPQRQTTKLRPRSYPRRSSTQGCL